MAQQPFRRSKRTKQRVFSEHLDASTGGAPSLTVDVATVRDKSRRLFPEELPLDVLGEILARLEPLDLLHLARATKCLRGLLLARSSAGIWKRSRDNVEDLPPCPEVLSDPQYANLMFSTSCHNCLDGDRTLFMYMEAWTQLCAECSLKEFAKWKDLPVIVDDELAKLVPSTTEILTEAERRNEKGPGKRDRREQRTRFHVKSVMALHESQKSSREAKASKKERGTWMKQQKAVWRKVEEEAARCRGYFKIQETKKQAQLEISLEQRKELIKRKLSELGWEDEFNYCGCCNAIDVPSLVVQWDIIHQRAPLTDEGWEDIKPGMVACMQDVRVAKQKHERRGAILQRIEHTIGPPYKAAVLSNDGYNEILVPTILDVALMDDFVAHLEAPPFDQDIAAGVLDDALARLPQTMAQWRIDIEERVLDILRESPIYADRTENVNRDMLFYASTAFTCKGCGLSTLRFPNVCYHQCVKVVGGLIPGNSYTTPQSRNRKKLAESPAPGDLMKEAFAFRPRTWKSLTKLQISEPVYHHTIHLLDGLGMERTTTVRVLSARNPYVECLCDCLLKIQNGRGRKAMRWGHALNNLRRHRSHGYENCIRVLDDDEMSRLNGYQSPDFVPSSHELHVCPWCLDSYWSSGELEGHLCEEHNLTAGEATTCTSQITSAPFPKFEEYNILNLD